jgi:hypothetical protein
MPMGQGRHTAKTLDGLDPYRRLAAAVIGAAVKDAQRGGKAGKEAANWLRSSPDAELYYAMTSVSRRRVVRWLDSLESEPDPMGRRLWSRAALAIGAA